MVRYIFLAPYAGDPTQGFDFAPIAPFDCVELVQPDTGDLYPDPPADTVMVWAYCQEHDRLTEPVEDEDALEANWRAAQVAMLEKAMAPALEAMKAEYTFVAEVEY